MSPWTTSNSMTGRSVATPKFLRGRNVTEALKATPYGDMGMPPRGQPLTATLRDICFLHWPVSESGVDERLPELALPDMADGSAWVKVVSAELRRIEVFGRPVRERVRVFLLRTYALSPARPRHVRLRCRPE